MRRLFVFLALVLIPVLAFAQAQTTGRVVGTVVNNAGEPVANAKVRFVSSALLGEREVTTAADGSFAAGILPVGPYSVTVKAPGMRTAEVAFRLGVGQTVPLEITLVKGEQIQETVTVYGTATAMETTAAGQNLSFEQIENLPINDRRLFNIASFAPNISYGPTGPGGGTSTSVSISGAPSYDTVVLLDGAEISDPYFGGGTTVYLEDAIEETQVLTSGVSARYGRFQGGVINAITKSGGNEFDASVRYSFWQEDWDSQTPFGESQSDERSETYQGTLGGYVLKDRLWFFGGYREIPASSTANTTVTTQESYTTAQTEERWQLKLKGAVNPNHIVEISKLEFDAGFTNRAGLPAGDLRAATGVRSDPRETQTITYQGVLTPNMFLDLQATEKDVQIASGASDITLGSPVLDWTSPGFRVYKNHWWGGTADPDVRNNETWGANLNWIKPVSYGTHSLEFGVQSVKSTTGGKNLQSATGLNLVANAPITGKPFVTGCVTAAGMPTGVSDCTFNIDPAFAIERWNANAVGIAPGAFDAEVENIAVYAQDTLTFGDLRVDIGFRYEEYDGNGPLIDQTVEFDAIAPRLGLTYNIDDNWQIQGTWANYTSRINDNVSNTVTFVGENPSQTELYTGPIMNNLTYDQIEALLADDSVWGVILARDDPTIPTTFLKGSLEAPYARDLTFAVKRRLPRNSGTVVLTYNEREFVDLLDDFIGEACNFADDPSTCSNTVAIPGGVVDATLWGNAPQARRSYDALSVVVDYRPSPKWNIGGNWTLADTTGNYEGEGQNTPGSGSEIGDFVNSRSDIAAVPDGFLDEHISQRVRLWGNYRLDFGRGGALSLGGVGTYQDGRAWSRQASVPYASDPNYLTEAGQTYTHFFDGRGQNTFDSWWSIDLAFNYSFKIWKKLDTFLQAQVLNVLDNDNLVAWDVRGDSERVNQTPVPPNTHQTILDQIDANGDGLIDDSGVLVFDPRGSFGNARNKDDFQLPRQYRFSVGLRW